MLKPTERETAERLLRVNPVIRQICQLALAHEDEHGKGEHYLGWGWADVRAAQAVIKTLVIEGLVKIAYQSRSTTEYRLADPELVRELLARDSAAVPFAVPDGLFDTVIGYDDAKTWLLRSLRADRPTHILLEGPPGTAKSLLLEAVASLPGAQFALGGSSTKAGIAEFLLNFRPRILVIDELEKMNDRDFSVLLSLMQSGVVARLTKVSRDQAQMQTWVFAGVNNAGHLPPELLSRFLKFRFGVYTAAEFREIVAGLVVRELGKDRAFGEYVADTVGRRSSDVRQALHVARLCNTPAEVDHLEVTQS